MSKKIANPQWPLKRAVTTFHRQTLEQLLTNLQTQTVFPNEIYPGFTKVNEERKRQAHGDHSKGWFSTGEGAKSFQGRIVSDDDAGNVTLQYMYRQYLRFVDIGVGKGVKKDDVDRARNVKYKSRYISRWARSTAGFSSRPGIMPELAHLETRLGTYLRDFYGWDFIETIASIEDNSINKMGKTGGTT